MIAYCYYAVPVRREVRTLTYNPLDGHCALARTPYDALLQLGSLDAGSMFAVWPMTKEAPLDEAGRICSMLAPLRIFIVVDPVEGVIFPLGLDPMLDTVVEVPSADPNG